jgi:hypothetical protein
MERSCSKPIDLTYNTQQSNYFSLLHAFWPIQALDYTNKDKTVALPEHKKKL